MEVVCFESVKKKVTDNKYVPTEKRYVGFSEAKD